LISILPADLSAQDRLAAPELSEAAILANLIKAGATSSSTAHASIHTRLGPEVWCASIILNNTVVQAPLGFLSATILIATVRALCSVSKACLRTKNWEALIIIDET
jgi:hypothetical protein